MKEMPGEPIFCLSWGKFILGGTVHVQFFKTYFSKNICQETTAIREFEWGHNMAHPWKCTSTNLGLSLRFPL